MEFLILDIHDGRLQLRYADAESAITLLPSEVSLVGKILMDPNGRTSFDELNGLGQCQFRRQGEEDMDMVLNAADG